MGTKRLHHDDSMPPESASRRTTNHPSKRRRSDHFAPPSTRSLSVNQLKSKIRDLTRALEHSDHLPAGVRIEKERALAGHKQDVEKIHEDKRKNELIKRYHMVRFFGASCLWPTHVKLGYQWAKCSDMKRAPESHKSLQKAQETP